jgi:hypothetical protein
LQAVQSQQEAELDIALSKLEQSRMMLAIKLKEHHGKNYKVIDEASSFVHNVYQNVWPSLSAVNKTDKCAGSSSNMAKGWNFFGRMASAGLALAGNSLNIRNVGGVLGNGVALGLGVLMVLQLHWMASSREKCPAAVGNNSYRRVADKLGTSPRITSQSNLDVSLARG